MSMRPLNFEFGTHAKRRERRIAAGVLTLAGVLLAVSGFRLLDAWQALEAAKSSAAASAPKRADAAFAPTPEQLEAQRKAHQQAERIADRLSIPWAELLNTFDQSVDADVALLSVQPDVGQGSVSVQAEARTPESAARFVKRLEQTHVLEHAHVVEHSYVTQDGVRPIRISVLAYWPKRDVSMPVPP